MRGLTGYASAMAANVRWAQNTHSQASSCFATGVTLLTKVLLYMDVSSVARTVGSLGNRGVRHGGIPSPAFVARRLRSAPVKGASAKHLRLLYILAGFPAGSISFGQHQQMCAAQAATMEAPTAANPLLEVTQRSQSVHNVIDPAVELCRAASQLNALGMCDLVEARL